MNRVLLQATHHGKALGALLSVGVAAFGVYAAGISLYVNDRWRNGTSRIYDSPDWSTVTSEHRSYVIAKRQRIVKSIHDLYQMEGDLASDGSAAAMFKESCVLEDPFYRFVGPKEILRAFANLHLRNKYITFKVYDPTHYQDSIIIKCEREFVQATSTKGDPVSIRSNIAVHLVVDEKGEEKINYIADEWNYVSLVQPETHNAFLFAGSVARMLRRAPSLMTHLYLEDNKSPFNPLRIFDAIKECRTYISQQWTSEKVEGIELKAPKQESSESSVTRANKFDARVKNS